MPRGRSPRAAVLLTAASLVLGTLAGGAAHAATFVEEGSILSFDNAPIYYTLFEPADPATYSGDADGDIPVVFMTHGWAGSRVRSADNGTVRMLLDAGYAVVTWDSRGFGRSGGEANVDAMEYEVRDLQALIDSIVVRPEIATDDRDFTETIQIEVPCNELEQPSPLVEIPSPVESVLDEVLMRSPPPSPTPCPEEPEIIEIEIDRKGMDPRMGMLGGSYAGGIQLMLASADPRVDAIIPEITWHDLPQSLKPNGVIKLGWDLLLYGAGAATGTTGGLTSDPSPEVGVSPEPDPSGTPDPRQSPTVVLRDPPQAGSLAPQIHQALAEGTALNDWSSATFDWFEARSTGRYLDGGRLADDTEVPGLSAATMLIQGTNDTLFDLTQAIKNFNAIKARTDTRYDDDPDNPRSNGGSLPAKLVAFCGGHTFATVGVPFPTSCTAGSGQADYLNALKTRWLDRWVKLDTAVSTGPAVEYQLQGGEFRQRTHLPLSTLAVKGDTRLKNTVAPQSGAVLAPTVGGCHPKASKADAANPAASCPAKGEADWFPIGTLTGPPVPRDPLRAPTLEFPRGGTVMLGSGRVKASVLGLAPEVYFFLKLIEWNPVTKTSTIIDDQVTAVKIPWPSLDTRKTVTFDLNGVAWEIKPAQVVGNRTLPYEYYMEVTTTSGDHASSRYPSQSTVFVDATIPAIVPPFVTAPPTNFYPKAITESLRVPAKASGALTIKGTAEPGAVVTITDRGPQLGTVTTGSNGIWSLSSALAEGEHVIDVSTTADLNGTVINSGERCFAFDDLTVTPPTPDVVKPAEGAVLTSRTVTLEGTALPGATIVVKEGDTTITPPLGSGADVRGSYCGTTAGTWKVTKTYTAAEAGQHTLTVFATDGAGNLSPVTTRTFTTP